MGWLTTHAAGLARLCAADRVFLSAASRLLPRINWSAFVVTPATLSGGTGSWSRTGAPINDHSVDQRSRRTFVH